MVIGRARASALAVAAMAMLSLSPGAARAQADAAMSCGQISDAVTRENASIKSALDDKQALTNGPGDPGAADPAVKERLDDIAAEKATARANALVALGRQKKCFR